MAAKEKAVLEDARAVNGAYVNNVFRTRRSAQDRRHTPSGEKLRKEYTVTIDDNGHKVLQQTGYTNQYGLIQENLENTLIETILDRAAMGDPEALERANTQYMDTTKMPKSLAEAQNKVLEIRQEFYKLPVDIRQKFDHSPEKFIQQYGSKEWADAVGLTAAMEKQAKIDKANKEIKEFTGTAQTAQKEGDEKKMNRETESHFAHIPSADIKRSRFKRPHTHKTTFNTGDLIPIYVDSDILPGDTVEMDMGMVCRMATPIYPVMDNAYLDLYFFFVPHRLVWEHWREFWGENRQTAWEQKVEYEIPQITAPAETGWTKDSLADYMGIPTKVPGISVNHLPFRAYCQIVNDWFRDENLKDPCMMNIDETTLTGLNKERDEGEDAYDYVTDTQLGAAPFKAAKFHDYFTSALPSPQKGPEVMLPLGQTAPLKTGTELYNPTVIGEYPAMTWTGNSTLPGYENGETVPGNNMYPVLDNGQLILRDGNQGYAGTGIAGIIPNNLYADLSNAVGASIEQLRQAFAVQAFYEAQARGGSRYIEFIRNIFGVTSPDARQQRAEYMGGKRIPINMDQVLQTSSTDSTSPQGNTAAFSVTADSSSLFTHSFTEHGTLMGLAVVRTDHTYQQGLERMWLRKKWTDFYVPQFANLGEQAILNAEIYAQNNEVDKEAFGYQEAWADYRYKPNRVSGCFRSNYDQSLDSWHYADDYATQPILSSTWIDETTENMDRTLAVQSRLEDQFLADFFFDATYVRPMPLYSIPGFMPWM